jgi:nucleoside 2-deoxyribosyltransferase
MVTIYLAGAIRDGRLDDIEWREKMISRLLDDAWILNPLASKHYDPATNKWTLAGRRVTAHSIVKYDFDSVKRADIVVANLLSLSERYPSIGTLIELGAAAAQGKLIYLIMEKKYTGHENAIFTMHPFLQEMAADIFESVDEAIEFLTGYLPAMSGDKPKYGSKRA